MSYTNSKISSGICKVKESQIGKKSHEGKIKFNTIMDGGRDRQQEKELLIHDMELVDNNHEDA